MNLRKDHYRCQAKALLWLTRYHRPCRGGSPRVPLGRAAELPRHVLSVRRVQGRVLGEAPPAWPGRVPIEWGQVCLGNTSFRSGYLALPGHMLLGLGGGEIGPDGPTRFKEYRESLVSGPPSAVSRREEGFVLSQNSPTGCVLATPPRPRFFVVVPSTLL